MKKNTVLGLATAMALMLCVGNVGAEGGLTGNTTPQPGIFSRGWQEFKNFPSRIKNVFTRGADKEKGVETAATKSQEESQENYVQIQPIEENISKEALTKRPGVIRRVIDFVTFPVKLAVKGVKKVGQGVRNMWTPKAKIENVAIEEEVNDLDEE